MTKRPASPAAVIIAGMISGLSALLAPLILLHTNFPLAARVLISLLPLPFFIAFIWAELQWIRSQDEFHRGVILESLAIAFPLAIVIAVVVESLQNAGLLMTLTVGDVWPFMALSWLPALWVARRRYS
jgi:uncharacterized membrane protein